MRKEVRLRLFHLKFINRTEKNCKEHGVLHMGRAGGSQHQAPRKIEQSIQQGLGAAGGRCPRPLRSLRAVSEPAERSFVLRAHSLLESPT